MPTSRKIYTNLLIFTKRTYHAWIDWMMARVKRNVFLISIKLNCYFFKGIITLKLENETSFFQISMFHFFFVRENFLKTPTTKPLLQFSIIDLDLYSSR